MKRTTIIFVFLLSKVVCAQNLDAKDFVIDKSKPYVYLEFDHISPQAPIRAGMPDGWLWLKVVNNCRVAIAFRSFGIPINANGSATGLFDEVVANEQGIQIYSDTDSFEAKEQKRQQRLKKMPESDPAEVSSIATVQPGEKLLFGVPLNHVDEYWHLNVKFALVLDKSTAWQEPFTSLSFYDSDIPKEQRPAKTHN